MASRFWVGGTGTWDASTTTNWAASSGGAGGQSVPGSGDAVTFDAASGGGTVTVNTNATVQSITGGAFTGTLTFATNNNTIGLNATAGFNFSGSGVRTLTLGSATFNLSASDTSWDIGTTSNLTFSGASSTINFTNTAAGRKSFKAGNITYGTVSIAANAAGAVVFSQGGTITTLALNAPCFMAVATFNTLTVTNSFSANGSSGNPIGIASDGAGSSATISSANNTTLQWAGIRDVTFTGGGTFAATSSFNLGNNSGITITAPSSGGGISRARAASGFH